MEKPPPAHRHHRLRKVGAFLSSEEPGRAVDASRVSPGHRRKWLPHRVRAHALRITDRTFSHPKMQLAQDGSLLAKLSGLSGFLGAIPWIFRTNTRQRRNPAWGPRRPTSALTSALSFGRCRGSQLPFCFWGLELILLNCTKKIDGNTSFKEATKGFQKELTNDQRKSAIEQLQTETAGKP